MRSDLQERRSSSCLTCVIDQALDLADECGWRYAILYLVHERVPGPIIQRLLSGEGKIRQTLEQSKEIAPTVDDSEPGEMKDIFDWLQQRRSKQAGEESSCASPAGAPLEVD
ncbi:hypothetical protein GM658_25215 [Pseudoduganella eburnea]|uniref:Uncharacterized protein n=1 Tax=Massilia eburnea TaxID=1776165 RepID=A0A6L6QNC2_9BURK|nr:hypothetical protein [Massilia eburnea]MTW13918.1 hypothetical protein [Massilia eburnea]